MKIELDLPVPDGWRFVGYQLPKEGQGFIRMLDKAFMIAKHDFFDGENRLTFERIEPVDTELEAVKAKFPIGSKVQYKKGTYGLEGEVRVVKDIHCCDDGFTIEYADVVNGFGDVRNLEPYVEDTELEEAKKLIGKWVTVNDVHGIFQIVEVERIIASIIVTTRDGRSHLVDSCRIKTIPTWRCCESDKPKNRGGDFHIRDKEKPFLKTVARFDGAKWSGDIFISRSEWLDEGER